MVGKSWCEELRRTLREWNKAELLIAVTQIAL